jgi:hypothetical protein
MIIQSLSSAISGPVRSNQRNNEEQEKRPFSPLRVPTASMIYLFLLAERGAV